MAGEIFLGGTVKPGGPFSIVIDTDLAGSYRVVVDLTERDAILTANRKFGMEVFVQSNATLYRLGADLVTWNEVANNSVVSQTALTCPPGVAVRDLVYVSAADTVDQASAAVVSTTPAVAMVISKPTTTSAVVAYSGEVAGFAGLTPGAQYYMSTTPGGIALAAGLGFPTVDGQVVQPVGRARSTSVFVFQPLFFLGL